MRLCPILDWGPEIHDRIGQAIAAGGSHEENVQHWMPLHPLRNGILIGGEDFLGEDGVDGKNLLNTLVCSPQGRAPFGVEER